MAAKKFSLPKEKIVLKQGGCGTRGEEAVLLLPLADEDDLDTWLSSALFPFSIFGWPDQVCHAPW